MVYKLLQEMHWDMSLGQSLGCPGTEGHGTHTGTGFLWWCL